MIADNMIVDIMIVDKMKFDAMIVDSTVVHSMSVNIKKETFKSNVSIKKTSKVFMWGFYSSSVEKWRLNEYNLKMFSKMILSIQKILPLSNQKKVIGLAWACDE